MAFVDQMLTAKDAKRHVKKLNRMVNAFIGFLGRKPKPSDEEIRVEFIKAESEWKVYCITHKLGTRVSEMFNAKVSYEWEKRTAQPLK